MCTDIYICVCVFPNKNKILFTKYFLNLTSCFKSLCFPQLYDDVLVFHKLQHYNSFK